MNPPVDLLPPEDDSLALRRELLKQRRMIEALKTQRNELADIVVSLKSDLDGALADLAAIRQQPKGV